MNLLGMIKGGPAGVATLPWDGAAFAHWFAPDGPDATALRAQHAETRRQALRQAAAPMVSPLDSLPSTPDLARRFFNALPQGPSAQAAPTPGPNVPMPQPRPNVPTDTPQGPPAPPSDVPMPTPRPNVPGDVAAGPPMPFGSGGGPAPMPQPRPPSAPSPIPGYNPNIGNMADPSMMKGNLQARQILDPATGQMMNDFYTAKPWDVFSGPTQQQSKGANIRDFLAALQRSRA